MKCCSPKAAQARRRPTAIHAGWRHQFQGFRYLVRSKQDRHAGRQIMLRRPVNSTVSAIPAPSEQDICPSGPWCNACYETTLRRLPATNEEPET
jgi:hypothetical protein